MGQLSKIAVVVGLAVGCGGVGDGDEPTSGRGASGAPGVGDAGSASGLPKGGSGDSPVGGGGGSGDEAASGAAGARSSMPGGGGQGAMNGDGGEAVGGSGVAVGGGGSDTAGSSCEPDPDTLPGDELGDPNGCTYTGTVVVPGRADQSGILVSIVGTVLKAETDADGFYEIAGVPRGSRRVHFSDGDFRETIPEVKCGANGVPMVAHLTLDEEPIELYIGTRLRDGSPLRLNPQTGDRVFYKAAESGSISTYVVDHECEPAALLPCSAVSTSEDGSLVVCSGSGSLSAYAVPRDAADSVELLTGATATFRASGVLAYVKDGSTHVFEVQSRRDRIVGTAGTFGVWVTPDDEHALFVNAASEIALGETKGDAAAVAVDSFTKAPPASSTTFEPKLSSNGDYVAYVPGYCTGPCTLRLLETSGAVRTLGALYARDSFQFSPDSKFVVVRLDTGAIVGFPTAGGAAVTYTLASSFFPAFLGDGSSMTLPSGESTILFDVETGESLGETERGGVRVATPDGRLVLMQRQFTNPSRLELVIWDTVTLESHLVEPDFESSLPVLMAPDAKSAVFVAGAYPNYTLNRVSFDDSFTVSTLATAQNFTRNIEFSSDGKLAFYADGALLVALPGDAAAITVSARLDSQAVLAWLGTSTIVTELNGRYPFQNGVYALTVPLP